MLGNVLVRQFAIAIQRRQLHKSNPRVLITGGCGQIGVPLARRLR
jgi:hypothetical protein